MPLVCRLIVICCWFVTGDYVRAVRLVANTRCCYCAYAPSAPATTPRLYAHHAYAPLNVDSQTTLPPLPPRLPRLALPYRRLTFITRTHPNALPHLCRGWGLLFWWNVVLVVDSGSLNSALDDC